MKVIPSDEHAALPPIANLATHADMPDPPVTMTAQEIDARMRAENPEPTHCFACGREFPAEVNRFATGEQPRPPRLRPARRIRVTTGDAA